MANGINQNLVGADALTAIVSSDNFVKIDPDMQNKIIDTVHSNIEKDGGVMGKFLGNRPTNASMHISLLLCMFLIIILLVDTIHSYCVGENINIELVNVVVPVISLSLGYIFGKSSN